MKVPIQINRLSGFLIASIVVVSSHATTSIHSGKNEFADNPFMAIGVNPGTKVVTGYVSALLTAPDKTDAGKFLFRGMMSPDGKARLAIKDAVAENQPGAVSKGKERAVLTATKNAIKVDLPKSLAPGDCAWALESVGGANIETTVRSYKLSVEAGAENGWIGVAAIRSKRASFYNAPDVTAVRKAFLVAGDIVYVMEERPGWYRVRFTHAVKATSGWIKASDTVQF